MDETRKKGSKYSPQYSSMSQLLAVRLLNWKNHGWNQPKWKSVFPPVSHRHVLVSYLALKGNKELIEVTDGCVFKCDQIFSVQLTRSHQRK